MTVVLDPFVTAQFLGVISSTLNGEAVVKGRSPVPGPPRRARSPPRSSRSSTTRRTPSAYTATDVDGEGLAARRNVLIEGGVLRQFVHNSATRPAAPARCRPATPCAAASPARPASAAWRCTLLPGTRTQAELVADVDDGLLVQQVQGLHSGVNPISGDFSTGASGLLITNGTVGAPVREFTIASTLQRMLLDIVEVGGDVDWLPMRAAGVSLVIRDVTMSGT